jgi:hypothetical protein
VVINFPLLHVLPLAVDGGTISEPWPKTTTGILMLAKIIYLVTKDPLTLKAEHTTKKHRVQVRKLQYSIGVVNAKLPGCKPAVITFAHHWHASTGTSNCNWDALRILSFYPRLQLEWTST